MGETIAVGRLPGPVLALDIGGTKLAGGIVVPSVTSGGKPEIICRRTKPTDSERGGAAVAQTVAELAVELIADHRKIRSAGASDLVGVGLASAGVIDEATGSVISATDTIPQWAGIPIGAIVSEAVNLPVRALNDVHAHALGEATWGAAAGEATALLMAIGTGIGGAFVANGKVLRGAHGVSGSLGHIRHPLADGFRCSCGRSGHIEAVASGTGIVALHQRRSGRNLVGTSGMTGSRELQQLAEKGDPLARSAFVESGHALGEVIGSLANCFDPDIIVLTGSVTLSGTRWWNSLRQGFAEQSMTLVVETPIVKGVLGGDAPLHGAATHFSSSIAPGAHEAQPGTIPPVPR